MALRKNRLPSTPPPPSAGALATTPPSAAWRKPASKPSPIPKKVPPPMFALRAKWDYLIAYLAPSLGFTMADIDPEGSHPHLSDEREPFAARLRSPD